MSADADAVHLWVLTNSVIVETEQGALELTPKQVRVLAVLVEKVIEYEPTLKPTDEDRADVVATNFEKGGDA